MSVSNVTVDGVSVDPRVQVRKTPRSACPCPSRCRLATAPCSGLNYRHQRAYSRSTTGYGLLSYTNGILALDTPYAPIPVYNGEGWNVETPPANADTSFNDASFYLTASRRARRR